jgi:hypothetical protein
MSSFVSGLVSQLNRCREPSLPDFWVFGYGAIEISINSGKNLVREVANAGHQSVQENDLKLRVIGVDISREVRRAGITSKGDVLISKCLKSDGSISGKVNA